MAEARRMRLLEPGTYWIATPSGRDWRVARLGRPPGAKRPPASRSTGDRTARPRA